MVSKGEDRRSRTGKRGDKGEEGIGERRREKRRE